MQRLSEIWQSASMGTFCCPNLTHLSQIANPHGLVYELQFNLWALPVLRFFPQHLSPRSQLFALSKRSIRCGLGIWILRFLIYPMIVPIILRLPLSRLRRLLNTADLITASGVRRDFRNLLENARLYRSCGLSNCEDMYCLSKEVQLYNLHKHIIVMEDVVQVYNGNV